MSISQTSDFEAAEQAERERKQNNAPKSDRGKLEQKQTTTRGSVLMCVFLQGVFGTLESLEFRRSGLDVRKAGSPERSFRFARHAWGRGGKASEIRRRRIGEEARASQRLVGQQPTRQGCRKACYVTRAR